MTEYSTPAVSGFTTMGGTVLFTARHIAAARKRDNGSITLLLAEKPPLFSPSLRRVPLLRTAAFLTDAAVDSFSVLRWSFTGTYHRSVLPALLYFVLWTFMLFILLPELLFSAVTLTGILPSVLLTDRALCTAVFTAVIITAVPVIITLLPAFSEMRQRHAAEHMVLRAWKRSRETFRSQLRKRDMTDTACGSVLFFSAAVLISGVYILTALFFSAADSTSHLVLIELRYALVIPCFIMAGELHRIFRRVSSPSLLSRISSFFVEQPETEALDIVSGTLKQLVKQDRLHHRLHTHRVDTFKNIHAFQKSAQEAP